MFISKRKVGDYFWLQKLVLRITGVSFRENDSIVYRIYSILVIFLCSGLVVAEGYTAVLCVKDVDLMITVLSVFSSHILGIYKAMVLLKHRLSIGKILRILEDDQFISNIKTDGVFERQLLKSGGMEMRKQITIYVVAFIMTFVNAVISSLLTKIRFHDYRDWEVPVLPWKVLRFETTKAYIVTYLFCSIPLGLHSTLLIFIDLLIVGVMAHIRTLFMILKNSMENLVWNAWDAARTDGGNPKSTSDISKKCLRKSLKDVVVYHQKLLLLCEEMEKLFNVLILSVCLGNVVALCLTMYHATLYPLVHTRSIQDYTYTALICWQVLIYCYWGNKVTHESTSLSFACYSTDFVGTDVNFQKDLMMIMRRSQKPIFFTAGKFVHLSIPTFVMMLRASYSYFMLLRKVNT